jgi:hypothetical protein
MAERVGSVLALETAIAHRLLAHPSIGWNETCAAAAAAAACGRHGSVRFRRYLCECWAEGDAAALRDALGVPVPLAEGTLRGEAECALCGESASLFSACAEHWFCAQCWAGHLNAQAASDA